MSNGSMCLTLKFQSTLPGWGATVGLARAGATQRDFNPRSPDGERLISAIVIPK